METALNWSVDPGWRADLASGSANRAEHVIAGRYELVAFDLPAASGFPAEIGWEVFTGPKLQEQVATGTADSFEAAKVAAEDAWRALGTH